MPWPGHQNKCGKKQCGNDTPEDHPNRPQVAMVTILFDRHGHHKCHRQNRHQGYRSAHASQSHDRHDLKNDVHRERGVDHRAFQVPLPEKLPNGAIILPRPAGDRGVPKIVNSKSRQPAFFVRVVQKRRRSRR